MARLASRRQRAVLFVLVLLPLWSSYLVRVYAWRLMLNKNGVVNWTRTVSPSMVNEFRVGMNYVKINNGADYGDAGPIGEQRGMAGVNAAGPGLLALNMTNGVVGQVTNGVGGIGNSNIYQLFADTVFQIQDGLIVTKGRHTLHTGFQLSRRIGNAGGFLCWLHSYSYQYLFSFFKKE